MSQIQPNPGIPSSVTVNIGIHNKNGSSYKYKKDEAITGDARKFAGDMPRFKMFGSDANNAVHTPTFVLHNKGEDVGSSAWRVQYRIVAFANAAGGVQYRSTRGQLVEITSTNKQFPQIVEDSVEVVLAPNSDQRWFQNVLKTSVLTKPDPENPNSRVLKYPTAGNFGHNIVFRISRDRTVGFQIQILSATRMP